MLVLQTTETYDKSVALDFLMHPFSHLFTQEETQFLKAINCSIRQIGARFIIICDLRPPLEQFN